MIHTHGEYSRETFDNLSARRSLKVVEVFLSDCTVTGAKESGVWGETGACFHLKNVCVEKCKGGVSVYAITTEKNTMTDCDVNNNKESGVCVHLGRITTIDGSATTIHHNVTSGKSNCYGLNANSSSSMVIY